MASHRQCDLYYAYFHRDPETDVIVYVGVGTLDRAWQVNNRSKDHKEWLVYLCNEGYLLSEVVQLGGSGMSRKMALEHELKLIEEHKPKYNKNYNYPSKISYNDFVLMEEMRYQGHSYSDIARTFKLSVMTIHRALNGGTKAHEKFKSI